MSSFWQVVETGSLSPNDIMAKDAYLLGQLTPDSTPILHFYDWDRPCLTHGYFTDPSCYLDLEALQRCGLQTARRPTGGGIIFHLTDLAFSVLIPANHPQFSLNTLENYAFINRKVADSIAHFTSQRLNPQLFHDEAPCSKQECTSFCMAKPTQYDLIIEGKKVGGAAQRRTRNGLLHQGSISLLFPPIDMMREILKNHETVLEAMQQQSYCLLSKQSTPQELQEARHELKKLLRTYLIRSILTQRQRGGETQRIKR